MKAVGIRELKNKLSHYLRLVEAGESVLVTDRGTVVAELRAAGPTTQTGEHASTDPLDLLVHTGVAVRGAPHDPELYEPQCRVLAEGILADLLEAERADG